MTSNYKGSALDDYAFSNFNLNDILKGQKSNETAEYTVKIIFIEREWTRPYILTFSELLLDWISASFKDSWIYPRFNDFSPLKAIGR